MIRRQLRLGQSSYPSLTQRALKPKVLSWNNVRMPPCLKHIGWLSHDLDRKRTS